MEHLEAYRQPEGGMELVCPVLALVIASPNVPQNVFFVVFSFFSRVQTPQNSLWEPEQSVHWMLGSVSLRTGAATNNPGFWTSSSLAKQD